jgi:nicotinamidase/pyrazinamidase
MRLHLLIIDPQNDFCDPSGSLYVPGADEDMKRLSDFINRISSKIDDIHVTVDSHHLFDVAHPMYWKDSSGNNPQPFTIITDADVKSGKWHASVESEREWSIKYTEGLSAQANKFPLCIWPYHCIIGSPGHNIYPPIFDSLSKWEKEQVAISDIVTKGSNYKTEHYGGLMAEVVDPDDPGTQLNTSLIQTLQTADMIVCAGEALSHCLATTLTQVIENFGDDNAKKLVLLEDCMSPVPGFEKAADDFIVYAKSHGVKFEKSTQFMV